MVSPRLLIPLFTASWFFAAAGYLTYKGREYPRAFGRMWPIAAYLTGIGAFFVIQAINTTTFYRCTIVDCSNLGGGIAVMLAASFIARFPIGERWPDLEQPVFRGMVVLTVVTQVTLALVAPGTQVTVAHVYGFFVAGVFTIGFVLYHAVRERSRTGVSVGLSMSSCCVMGHGTAALPLVATVSLPLIGVPLAAPVLFAVLAPISLIATLAFVANVDPAERAAVEGDAGASG